MWMDRVLLGGALSAAAVLAAASCASNEPSDPAPVASAGAPGTDAMMDAPLDVSLDVDPLPAPTVKLYAHNDTTLYEVDVRQATLPITQVGTFDCIPPGGSMTDIAVDADGRLFGVSTSTIFLDMKVEQGYVLCSERQVRIERGSVADARFYGLGIIPATPSLGTQETLVGANSNGDLYAIDQQDGTLTLIGSFGTVPATDPQGNVYAHAGQRWELSGDIQFFANEGKPTGFATVRDCPNPPATTDCSLVVTLLEIDVAAFQPVTPPATAPVVTRAVRGQIRPEGCTTPSCGFGSIYGLGALGSKVYGFSRRGDIVRIDNATGQGELVSTPLPPPPSSNAFAGAGLTTIAQIDAPPPR